MFISSFGKKTTLETSLLRSVCRGGCHGEWGRKNAGKATIWKPCCLCAALAAAATPGLPKGNAAMWTTV